MSAKTAIALKAITEQAKEIAREQKDGLVEKVARRGKGLDLGPANAGVSQRDELDRLQLKQVSMHQSAQGHTICLPFHVAE